MGLIVLEALFVLALFVFIIWWTMFSGRHKGELRAAPPPSAELPAPNAPPPAKHSDTP